MQRMHPLAGLQHLRSVGTRAILARGVLVGSLTAAERLLVPATAWAAFSSDQPRKLLVGVLLGIVFSLRSFAQGSLAARTEADLLERVITSVLDGDVLRASVLADQDAQAELSQGVYFATQQVAEVLPTLAGDTVASLVLAAVLLSVEPVPVLLGTFGVLGAAALFLFGMRGRVVQTARLAWQLRDRLLDQLVDAIEGRIDIVAGGRQRVFNEETGRRARAWKAASVRVALNVAFSGRVPLLMIASAVLAVTVLGSRWHSATGVSLANAALVASAIPAFAGIIQGAITLTHTERWVRTVAEVISGRRQAQGGNRRSQHMWPIVFEGVCFRYDGARTDAVRDLRFSWHDERVLAVAGSNGSGKTTFLRLLIGLAMPQSGAVRIGAIPLHDVDAEHWRQQLGFLSQRPYLPMRSDIRTSIRLLAPGATDSRMTRALDRVGLLGLLREAGPDPLAIGVDTLSVGQRQRVALARILCRDVSLFVFDEPDANLDRAGIELVRDLVRELSAEHRVLLTAHTRELLDVADRVIALDRGRIVSDDVKNSK